MDRNKKRILIIAVIAILLIFFVNIIPKLLRLIIEPTKTFTLYRDQIIDDEKVDAVIIRKEKVISDNRDSKIEKLKKDGQRVATNENIFRYYTDKEQDILNEIEGVNKKINDEVAKNDNIVSDDSDIIIDKQIAVIVEGIKKQNNLDKIDDYKKKIENLMGQKIYKSTSLNNNKEYLDLVDQKKRLETKLNESNTTINSQTSGLVSYRIDGYESLFQDIDFNNINKDILNKVKVRKNLEIQESNQAKVVEDFNTYLAVNINTAKSKKAKVGDYVYIKFGDDIPFLAVISNINKNKNDQVIIFRTTKQQERLLKYRSISIDIMWEEKLGLKVNNSALYKKGNVDYIAKDNLGYITEIPVIITYSTQNFSLIRNMTEEELKSNNIDTKDVYKVREYDEIILKPHVNN